MAPPRPCARRKGNLAIRSIRVPEPGCAENRAPLFFGRARAAGSTLVRRRCGGTNGRNEQSCYRNQRPEPWWLFHLQLLHAFNVRVKRVGEWLLNKAAPISIGDIFDRILNRVA